MYVRMYVQTYCTYKNLHYGVLLKISRVNLNNKDRHSAPRTGEGSEHKRERERQQRKLGPFVQRERSVYTYVHTYVCVYVCMYIHMYII